MPKQSENGAAKDRLSPMKALRLGRDQFTELTGLVPESVSSFERTADLELRVNGPLPPHSFVEPGPAEPARTTTGTATGEE